jgi:hypothetical protein
MGTCLGAGPFVFPHFGFWAVSHGKIKIRETFEFSSRPCHHESTPVNHFHSQAYTMTYNNSHLKELMQPQTIEDSATVLALGGKSSETILWYLKKLTGFRHSCRMVEHRPGFARLLPTTGEPLSNPCWNAKPCMPIIISASKSRRPRRPFTDTCAPSEGSLSGCRKKAITETISSRA